MYLILINEQCGVEKILAFFSWVARGATYNYPYLICFWFYLLNSFITFLDEVVKLDRKSVV